MAREREGTFSPQSITTADLLQVGTRVAQGTGLAEWFGAQNPDGSLLDTVPRIALRVKQLPSSERLSFLTRFFGEEGLSFPHAEELGGFLDSLCDIQEFQLSTQPNRKEAQHAVNQYYIAHNRKPETVIFFPQDLTGENVFDRNKFLISIVFAQQANRLSNILTAEASVWLDLDIKEPQDPISQKARAAISQIRRSSKEAKERLSVAAAMAKALIDVLEVPALRAVGIPDAHIVTVQELHEDEKFSRISTRVTEDEKRRVADAPTENAAMLERLNRLGNLLNQLGAWHTAADAERARQDIAPLTEEQESFKTLALGVVAQATLDAILAAQWIVVQDQMQKKGFKQGPEGQKLFVNLWRKGYWPIGEYKKKVLLLRTKKGFIVGTPYYQQEEDQVDDLEPSKVSLTDVRAQTPETLALLDEARGVFNDLQPVINRMQIDTSTSAIDKKFPNRFIEKLETRLQRHLGSMIRQEDEPDREFVDVGWHLYAQNIVPQMLIIYRQLAGDRPVPQTYLEFAQIVKGVDDYTLRIAGISNICLIDMEDLAKRIQSTNPVSYVESMHQYLGIQVLDVLHLANKGNILDEKRFEKFLKTQPTEVQLEYRSREFRRRMMVGIAYANAMREYVNPDSLNRLLAIIEKTSPPETY